MKQRLIVALIGAPLLFVVLFFLPPFWTAVLVSLISAVSSYELLMPEKDSHGSFMIACTAVFAASVPLCVLLGCGSTEATLLLLLFAAAAFLSAMLRGANKRAGTGQIAAEFFSAFAVPYLLSSLVLLAVMDGGRYLVLLPFIAAFSSDTGAFFIGCAFGKHRLAPEVSPKKSVEGSIAGLAAAVVFMCLYGLLLKFFEVFSPSFALLCIYGVIGSVLGQIGDLTFSLIKRSYGIKDFGTLLPGHGGVLDRFDSTVFTAPAIYLLMNWLPALK